MKKLVALSALLLISINCVQGSGSTAKLEDLNIQAWNTFLNLENNLIATQRELGPKPKGFFTSWFRSKPKNDVQLDLNELAQIYGTLNTGDIAALTFLKKNCRDGGLLIPATDPLLCQEYPDILSKQIQNRLDVINSKIVSSDGILKTPPGWLYHLITASELLKEIDARNAMEYRIRQAVARSISPEDTQAFDSTPNILNENADLKGSNEPVTTGNTNTNGNVNSTVDTSPSNVPEQQAQVIDPAPKPQVIQQNNDNDANLQQQPGAGVIQSPPPSAPAQAPVSPATQNIIIQTQKCPPSTSDPSAIGPFINDLTRNDLLVML